MAVPKLILVEGIMGSGKSTTAKKIAAFLKELGVSSELYAEGDLDHPADFEQVAGVDEPALAALQAKHPEHVELLEEMLVREGNDRLVYYAKERKARGEAFPQALYDDLKALDVYDALPLARHRELTLARWKRFAERQMESGSTIILECCFLQNPMCVFLAMHDAGRDAVKEHVLQLGEIVAPLEPLLIYFHQQDLRETLERVSAVRSKEWHDGVIHYHTQQAFGKARGLAGLDGLVQVLQERRSIELELCRELPFRTLTVDNSDYDFERGQAQALELLQNVFQEKETSV